MSDSTANREPRVTWGRFLMDVFICSLGAYGGPEAHLGVFTEQMVVRRKYLNETDLIELVALCSMLPGPTSTQTMVSIGYRMGGPVLALLTSTYSVKDAFELILWESGLSSERWGEEREFTFSSA